MPEGLLAPRLYRAAFAPALLALIIMAFSLQQPQRPLAPELSPPGFSAARAVAFAGQTVQNYGVRRSGSAADQRLADLVEARLQASGLVMTRQTFDATTLTGRQRLVNIIGVRAGPSDRRLLVIASRDGAPGALARSGALETGVLIELARVLEGRAFDHTIVLASVSGGVDGGLGADHLVGQLRGPFDATIVLRNVGARSATSAVLARSDSRDEPDARLVRTLRRIAAREIGGSDRYVPSFLTQLVRLGFPVALGEQSVLVKRGISGAAISPGGEPLAPVSVDAARIAGRTGQAALRALTTFDRSYRAQPPSAAPLQVRGKMIPQWALALLIGALFFPLIVVAVDSWARARRWRQLSQRGVLAPALALGWLLIIAFLLRGAAISGVIHAPPLASDPSALSGAAVTAIGSLALLLALLGVFVAAGAARQATPKGGEAGFALWLAFSGLAVFVINPIAAGFLLLPLHLITLLLLTGRSRRGQVAALGFVGALPLLAAGATLAGALGLAPGELLRYAVLLESGGFISPFSVVAASAVVAAVSTALIQLWWSAPRGRSPALRGEVTRSF